MTNRKDVDDTLEQTIELLRNAAENLEWMRDNCGKHLSEPYQTRTHAEQLRLDVFRIVHKLEDEA